MTKQQALVRLQKQLNEIETIRSGPKFSPEFKKWYRDTEVVIEKIFGDKTRHTKDFKSISYSLSRYSSTTPDSSFHQAFLRGLDGASSVLRSIIDEIQEYGVDKDENPEIKSLDIVRKICNRFHSVSRQLRNRHDNRETLNVDDEYDVQDLLHALLKVDFDDVRTEEWTQSYAGKAARMDFLLKKYKIVIETKRSRKSLTEKQLGDELIIDTQRYKKHTDCKMLFCFVYDPEGWIANPTGIETDLNCDDDSLKVEVLVAPKG
jgi:hypothetical protein